MSIWESYEALITNKAGTMETEDKDIFDAYSELSE